MSTMTMTQKTWLDSVRGKTSQNAVARAIGMTSGNLSTALKEDRLSAEQVIEISYSLGVDPIQSLIDTGFLRDYRRNDLTPRQIATRVKEDVTRLQWMAEHDGEHLAEVTELPVRSSPYDDDMPEDAAAYGGELFDTPHDDDDY